MRVEYLSQLESILKLRHEYSETRKYSELSKNSIKDINCTLMTDRVVNNIFIEIGKKRLMKIRSIKNYNHLSLDDINQDFFDQSQTLEYFWKKHLAIKVYLNDCRLFSGLEEKVKNNENKYRISKSIQEVEKYHELVTELFNERENLKKIKSNFSDLFEILSSLMIFMELKTSLQECKRRIMMAKTVGAINSQHVWIAEIISEKNSLEIIAEGIEDLSEILSSLPIFEKLLLDLKKHINYIMEEKNMEKINDYYIWFDELLSRKNDLKSIDREINEFRIFLKSNSFFKENKWLLLLEKDCANLKESNQIEKLHAKIKGQKKMLDAISEISTCWLEICENFHKLCEYSIINKIDNTFDVSKYFDKDKVNIINELSRLENQSALDYNKVLEIHNKLRNKFNHIKEIVNKLYPTLDFNSAHDLSDLIGNIFLLFINVSLIFFVWPFSYLIREIKKYFSIKKPVLDW